MYPFQAISLLRSRSLQYNSTLSVSSNNVFKAKFVLIGTIRVHLNFLWILQKDLGENSFVLLSHINTFDDFASIN